MNKKITYKNKNSLWASPELVEGEWENENWLKKVGCL